MDFCVIFDLDGTLVDSRADLTTGVNLMRREYGLDAIDIEKVTTYVGNGTRLLCERALQDSKVDVDEALPLMKRFYLEHLLDETALYDGVFEGLEALRKAGIPLAVVTNKPQEPTEAILKGLNVYEFFDFIIGGGAGFELKPAPDALVHILKKSASRPDKSFMVGDNYTDLESGRRAGMRTVFCEFGFGVTAGENYDFAVKSFADLVERVLDGR
ncbi:MAG: HAD-IIIA family hydrolase [Victivallales bacterium]|nr:HAD-IIIA family hydrolase [Victivallales bacterium]